MADDRPVPRRAVWAEDASVVFGVAGAVLSLGTGLAVLWLRFWGVLGADDLVLGLVAGVDLALILLSVTFHHLALELSEPDPPPGPPPGPAPGGPGPRRSGRRARPSRLAGPARRLDGSGTRSAEG